MNDNPFAISVNISAETWVQGSQEVLANVSGPNGSIVQEWENEPARLDKAWSNASLTVPGAPPGGGSGQWVSLPLPSVASVQPLELRVGAAVWELYLLTPAANSLAVVDAEYGLGVVVLVVSGFTALVILATLAAADRLGRRAYRTPRVRVWWPVAWILIPVFLFAYDYVDFNQVVGAFSWALFPMAFAGASFPYLLRRAARGSVVGEFEGIGALNLEEAENPKILLPIVKGQSAMRCAPESWWEVLYTLAGVPLPEIRGFQVQLLGRNIKVQPRGIQVTCPLGRGYASEAEVGFWYDARQEIKRAAHRFAWTRSEAVALPPPIEGQTAAAPKMRRRFSPHVVPGYLTAVFPPKLPVAKMLANVFAAETEAHDRESDRLKVAELMGQLTHVARKMAADSNATYEKAHQLGMEARSESESGQRVDQSHRTRDNGRPAGQ